MIKKSGDLHDKIFTMCDRIVNFCKLASVTLLQMYGKYGLNVFTYMIKLLTIELCMVRIPAQSQMALCQVNETRQMKIHKKNIFH